MTFRTFVVSALYTMSEGACAPSSLDGDKYKCQQEIGAVLMHYGYNNVMENVDVCAIYKGGDQLFAFGPGTLDEGGQLALVSPSVTAGVYTLPGGHTDGEPVTPVLSDTFTTFTSVATI